MSVIKRSAGEKVFAVFNYTIITLIVITTLYPFLEELSISFSGRAEALRPGFHIFPLGGIQIEAYRHVLRSHMIWTGYLNTIIRTGAGTVLAVFFTSLTAYPLSKTELPLRKYFTLYFLFTMLFSGGLIPTYLLIKSLGLLDTRFVLILQGMVSAFNVIIMRNFFKSLPQSLEDSARIDGAGNFKTLFSIVYPLSLPVLATVGLWVAVFHWNSWFDGLIYVTSRDKYVLQIVLRRILIQREVDSVAQFFESSTKREEFNVRSMRSAVVIVSVAPIICTYPFIQKYFIKGIMLGAVKG
jgi:putative aldouronate transport system permease protein